MPNSPFSIRFSRRSDTLSFFFPPVLPWDTIDGDLQLLRRVSPPSVSPPPRVWSVRPSFVVAPVSCNHGVKSRPPALLRPFAPVQRRVSPPPLSAAAVHFLELGTIHLKEDCVLVDHW